MTKYRKWQKRRPRSEEKAVGKIRSQEPGTEGNSSSHIPSNAPPAYPEISPERTHRPWHDEGRRSTTCPPGTVRSRTAELPLSPKPIVAERLSRLTRGQADR